jgi:exoribonuclease R
MKPDAKTIKDLAKCNSLFNEFSKELERDFLELIEKLIEEGSIGPRSQAEVNMCYVAFCLGAINSITETSHFYLGLSQYTQFTPDETKH